ncbi:MAG: N-acetyltransferase, partial [Pyrinomonadaceae bacterium]|nr:N-acetyltransferase [Pyrinomonadaceae bacterium]
FIQYAESGEGILALTHTEVPPEFEGRGVGSRLVKGTFEIVQAEGLKILPMCSFVATYLRRHPEYQQLVASE